ncbi:hypothetical protein X762_12335 [Mesorhizobium sp. LSHC426A00]|nr:hypothetical protein X762_12335 [Mesorhizobium sp. LSHC426A00]
MPSVLAAAPRISVPLSFFVGPFALVSQSAPARASLQAVAVIAEIYITLDQVTTWGFDTLDFAHRIDPKVPSAPFPTSLSALVIGRKIGQVRAMAETIQFATFAAPLPTLDSLEMSSFDATRNDLTSRVMLFTDACMEVTDSFEGRTEARNLARRLTKQHEMTQKIGDILFDAMGKFPFLEAAEALGLNGLEAYENSRKLSEIEGIVSAKTDKLETAIAQRRTLLQGLQTGLLALLDQELNRLADKAHELEKKKAELDTRSHELDQDQTQISNEQALLQALRMDIQDLRDALDSLRDEVRQANSQVASLRSEAAQLTTSANNARANWAAICPNGNSFDACGHVDLKRLRYFGPLDRSNNITSTRLPQAQTRASQLQATERSNTSFYNQKLEQERSLAARVDEHVNRHADVRTVLLADIKQYWREAYESRADLHRQENAADRERMRRSFQRTGNA